jgi:hypothetical protein
MTRRTYPRRTKPRSSRGIWIAGAIVSAIGVLLVVDMIFFGFWPFNKTTPMLTSTPTPIVPPVVKFSSINDGGLIAEPLDSAHGTYTQVPEDKDIWVVASRGSQCYPMDGPAIKEVTGVWRHGPLQFLESGKYELSTVLADEKSSAQLKMAVGKLTGLTCLPDGAEFIETISIEVRLAPMPTPTATVTKRAQAVLPETTPTKTATPTPAGVPVVGKVCEIRAGDDTNTIYLRRVEFTNLGLPPQARVDIHLEDTRRDARYVTLDVDPELAVCVASLSLALRTSLGVAEDILTPTPILRPDRHFIIAETQTEVKITSLSKGQVVPDMVSSVRGIYANVPADLELWIVVFVGANYYVQNGPARLMPDGTWSQGDTFFGGIHEFEVLAVLANAETAAMFRTYKDGRPLTELPSGARPLDSVMVVRQQ